MEFSSVPIIVLCCYIIGEIYKIVFKNKKESYKLIPLILSIFGGIIGIVIFYTNPEMILDAHNVWVALGVGIVSGASSQVQIKLLNKYLVRIKMSNKLPMFKDIYNQKIDFRFIAYSNIGKYVYECTYDDFMVYLGKNEPVNEIQNDIVKTKKMFELLKSNGINIETIDSCVLLFSLCFSIDKRDKLQNFLSKLNYINPFEDACELFMFIVKNKIFGEYTYKFAIVIFNAILFSNNILPIIFPLSYTFYLCELIESGLSIDSFEDIVMARFENSIIYNTPHELIDDNEAVKRIMSLKRDLVEKYGVKHIFITGSFAKKLYTKFSDLDLIIEMDNYDKIDEIEKYIANMTAIPVDAIRSDDPFTKLNDLQKYRINVF